MSFLVNGLEGLVYLKGKEIIHRDIKPDNLVIGTNGLLKIADFGFAVKAEKGVYSGEAGGALNYLSPEMVQQLPNERITYTYQCDQFAMGLVFEVAMNRDHLPYLLNISKGKGTLTLEKLQAISEYHRTRFERTSNYIINLKPDMIETVHQMMACDPLQRPSVEESLAKLKSPSSSQSQATTGVLLDSEQGASLSTTTPFMTYSRPKGDSRLLINDTNHSSSAPLLGTKGQEGCCVIL